MPTLCGRLCPTRLDTGDLAAELTSAGLDCKVGQGAPLGRPKRTTPIHPDPVGGRNRTAPKNETACPMAHRWGVGDSGDAAQPGLSGRQGRTCRGRTSDRPGRPRDLLTMMRRSRDPLPQHQAPCMLAILASCGRLLERLVAHSLNPNQARTWSLSQSGSVVQPPRRYQLSPAPASSRSPSSSLASGRVKPSRSPSGQSGQAQITAVPAI